MRVMYYVCDECGLLWDNCKDGVIRYYRGKHYCKKHAPKTTSTCKGCGATLRPSGERLSKWPGTKARVTKDSCYGCYRLGKKAQSLEPAKPEQFAQDVADDALTYLHRTGHDDLAVMIFGEAYLRMRSLGPFAQVSDN